MIFLKPLLLFFLFVLISSFGLPIVIDLILFLIIIFLIKFDNIILFNINLIILVSIIVLNFYLVKNIDENKIFYRAHERFFLSEESKYIKNINYKMKMPHGDIPALDVCYKKQNIFQPREQLFITDENGFRNDKFKINQADIILIGDSFIAGSSNSQEYIPANILSKLINKNVYAITSISTPEEYERHISENLNNFKKTAKLYLFYFSGNDFIYETTQEKNFKYYNSIPINPIKYNIRFGYERLERNKDKFHIKYLKKFYEKNYFYKKIRPQSQRFFKKALIKWTKTCPIKYKSIKNNDVGFYYNFFEHNFNSKTYIIKDKEILKRIDKIFYIPTKFEVYRDFIENADNSNSIKVKNFEFLKKEYNLINKDVYDLTETLIRQASNSLKNNKFIFWKDDTHWNSDGIQAAMEFVAQIIE